MGVTRKSKAVKTIRIIIYKSLQKLIFVHLNIPHDGKNLLVVAKPKT